MKTVAKKPPTTTTPTQAPKPLTLADITLIWNDGQDDHEASPEQIAIALEYGFRMCPNFKMLKDACVAHEILLAAEELILGFAHTVENGSDVTSAAYWAVHDLVRDARVRYELSNHPPQPETYHVQIAGRQSEGGAR